jgi:hypothetical protein
MVTMAAAPNQRRRAPPPVVDVRDGGSIRNHGRAALHVHVGVPEPEDAIRLLNSLREVAPIPIALSANSPFSHGLDTGFASARTVIFQGFPRTGTALRVTQRFAPSGATPLGAADSL